MIITPTEDHVTGDEILDKSDNDDDNDDMIHGTVSQISSGQHCTVVTVVQLNMDNADNYFVSV